MLADLRDLSGLCFAMFRPLDQPWTEQISEPIKRKYLLAELSFLRTFLVSVPILLNSFSPVITQLLPEFFIQVIYSIYGKGSWCSIFPNAKKCRKREEKCVSSFGHVGNETDIYHLIVSRFSKKQWETMVSKFLFFSFPGWFDIPIYGVMGPSFPFSNHILSQGRS